MKNIFVFLISFSTPFFSVCQIKFEKGYFINNKHIKTECFIKSVDWIYNPNSFVYKLSEHGRAETATVDAVEEFGVTNEYKYITASVTIDRSSDELEYMSGDREPNWNKEILFLKVLIEGDANLYSYKEPNFTRFFYKVDALPVIEQLIYKAFSKTGDINFQYNTTYINQINTNVTCNNLPSKTVEKIPYRETELTKYFFDYNTCKGTASATFNNDKKRKWISLRLAPSLRYSYLKGSFDASASEVSFDPKLSFAAGLEIEFFLPFNKNKWSVVLMPSTFSYKSTGTNNRTIDYNTIEISGGFRYYFYLNDKIKIYPDISLVKDIKRRSFTLAYGLGVSYGRVSAEFRHYTPKIALDYYYGDRLAFHKEGLIIGFRIL